VPLVVSIFSVDLNFLSLKKHISKHKLIRENTDPAMKKWLYVSFVSNNFCSRMSKSAQNPVYEKVIPYKSVALSP